MDGNASAAMECLIERYWTAVRHRDWATFGQLVHEQVLYEVPQTGERLRGRDAYVAFNSSHPGNWELEIDSIVAEGRQAVSKVAIDLDGESATGISFFEFRDGLIARITDYWPGSCNPLVRMAHDIE